MPKPKKKEEDKLSKLVHIAFLESEIELIDTYRKNVNMTRSEFIRQAIRDKIRRIKNPEMFTVAGNVGLSSEKLNQILKNQEIQMKEQKLLAKQIKDIEAIKENYSILRQVTEKEDIEEDKNTIISLLKVRKELRRIDIIQLSGISKQRVDTILSNSPIFTINMKTGKIKLNNVNKEED